jgi:hemoglobin
LEFCEVVSRFNGPGGRENDNSRLFGSGLPGVSIMASCKPLAAASLVAVMSACCPAAFAQAPPTLVPPPAIAPTGSLYERLGGTPKVTAFVGLTIDTVAANPAMNQSFDKVNLQHVKDMLIEQICSLTGGDCKYTGDTMRDVHAGHHISNAEFFGLVEVLRDAMRTQDVPLSARNELLEILAPMKRDVVKL